MNISVAEFRRILRDPQKKGSVLFLDVRTPEEHASERIPEVHNLPLQDLEKHVEDIRQYDEVYIHCQSGRRSQQAQETLAGYGIKSVNVTGGIAAWREQKQKTLRRGKGLPIMQQVLAIAGALVLIGALGAMLIHPWFLALHLLVGAGLLFAGLTGHCMMAFLLAKMPWNAAVRQPLPWESDVATCCT